MNSLLSCPPLSPSAQELHPPSDSDGGAECSVGEDLVPHRLSTPERSRRSSRRWDGLPWSMERLKGDLPGWTRKGLDEEKCHVGVPRKQENADEATWTCSAPFNKFGGL